MMEGLSGVQFWHQQLPREMDKILAGIPQGLDLPEPFEVRAPIEMGRMRRVLAQILDRYEAELSGVEIYTVRQVDGQLKGVGRRFFLAAFREQAARVATVGDVAAVIVKIASFYAPDYGKVGHPCHQWCPVWGKCADIQRVAITSLIQHIVTAYSAS